MASAIPLFVAVLAIVGIAALLVMNATEIHKKMAGILTWYSGLSCLLFVSIFMGADENDIVFILKMFLFSGAFIVGISLRKKKG